MWRERQGETDIYIEVYRQGETNIEVYRGTDRKGQGETDRYL